MPLQDPRKPRGDEVRGAIQLLHQAGLSLTEVQRLQQLLHLKPPRIPSAQSTFARFEVLELLVPARDGHALVWKQRWVQLMPVGLLYVYTVDQWLTPGEPSKAPVIHMALHQDRTSIQVGSEALKGRLGRDYIVNVTTKGTTGKSKAMTFAMETPEKLQEWSRCLSGCCVRKEPLRLSIFQATLAGNLQAVRACVERGDEINSKNSYGCSVLHFAIMRSLQGARLQAKGDSTCDAYASMVIVAYVLMQGADPDARDNRGETAEMHIRRRGRKVPAAQRLLFDLLILSRTKGLRGQPWVYQGLQPEGLVRLVTKSIRDCQEDEAAEDNVQKLVDTFNMFWTRRLGRRRQTADSHLQVDRSTNRRPSSAPAPIRHVPSSTTQRSALCTTGRSGAPIGRRSITRMGQPSQHQNSWPEKYVIGHRASSSPSLQPGEKARKLIRKLGVPIDATYGRPLSAPGYNRGSLRERPVL